MQRSEKHHNHHHPTPYTRPTTKDHHPRTQDCSPRTLLRPHLENTKNQIRMGSRAIDLVSTYSSKKFTWFNNVIGWLEVAASVAAIAILNDLDLRSCKSPAQLPRMPVLCPINKLTTVHTWHLVEKK